MPLNTPGLKAAIKAALTTMETKTEDSKDELAQLLATAFEAYVKTGTVTVTVNTAGSSTAQSGGGTGNIT